MDIRIKRDQVRLFWEFGDDLQPTGCYPRNTDTIVVCRGGGMGRPALGAPMKPHARS